MIFHTFHTKRCKLGYSTWTLSLLVPFPLQNPLFSPSILSELGRKPILHFPSPFSSLHTFSLHMQDIPGLCLSLHVSIWLHAPPPHSSRNSHLSPWWRLQFPQVECLPLHTFLGRQTVGEIAGGKTWVTQLPPLVSPLAGGFHSFSCQCIYTGPSYPSLVSMLAELCPSLSIPPRGADPIPTSCKTSSSHLSSGSSPFGQASLRLSQYWEYWIVSSLVKYLSTFHVSQGKNLRLVEKKSSLFPSHESHHVPPLPLHV